MLKQQFVQCRTLTKISKQFIFQVSIKVQMSCKMYSLVEITCHTEGLLRKLPRWWTIIINQPNDPPLRLMKGDSPEDQSSWTSWQGSSLATDPVPDCVKDSHTPEMQLGQKLHTPHIDHGVERERESHLISEKDLHKAL